MSDPIDRQMAISHVYVALFPNVRAAEKADKALREMPTVDAVEVVRCRNCKHKHLENMVLTCPFGLPGGEDFFCGYGAEPYKGGQDE